MVRRARVRRCNRLAGHRLAGGDPAAHRGPRGLRPVGQPRDPVQRPADRRRALNEVGDSSRTRPTSTAASATLRRSRRRRSRRAGCPILEDGASARCTAGALLRRAVAEGHERRARTVTSSRSTCPPIDPSKGKPVLGGGEFVGASTTTRHCQAFQTFLSSPEWANQAATPLAAASAPTRAWTSATSPARSTGSRLSPADPSGAVRFDGSDLMPATVGAGTFWKGMVDWINGQGHADHARPDRGLGGRSRDVGIAWRRAADVQVPAYAVGRVILQSPGPPRKPYPVCRTRHTARRPAVTSSSGTRSRQERGEVRRGHRAEVRAPFFAIGLFAGTDGAGAGDRRGAAAGVATPAGRAGSSSSPWYL